ADASDRRSPALPDPRCLDDQGAGPPLVPPRLLPVTGEDRRPPRAGRHPGFDPRAGLLPEGRVPRQGAVLGAGEDDGERGRRGLRTDGGLSGPRAGSLTFTENSGWPVP